MSLLIEKLNNICIEAKNQFKPDLKKYGRNFRAISESAVLEVLNPLFREFGITYSVVVREKNLHVEKIKAGRDQAGNLIEKLVFIADVVVALNITDGEDHFFFEGWGSGVDSGDKATGKAMTAAVKYALFKGLRLQYSDDPDAEASETIEDIVPEKKPIENSAPAKKGKEEKTEEKKATEKQLDFIAGMMKQIEMSDEQFYEVYKVRFTDSLPMRKARDIIDDLQKRLDESLPF